jgi:hypothetical protein
MLERIVGICLLSLVAVITMSCSSLRSEHYVGEVDGADMEEMDKETIWQFGEDVFYLRAKDEKTFVAATLEWDSKKKRFHASHSEIVLGELDDWMFLSVKGEDEEHYTIARIAPLTDEHMALYTIDRKSELDKYVLENVKQIFDTKIGGSITAIKGFEDDE